MFSTAGNTTDDEVVGAILEDLFQWSRRKLRSCIFRTKPRSRKEKYEESRASYCYFSARGIDCSQANLGLPQLSWMSRCTFPGEVLIGIFLFGGCPLLFRQTSLTRLHSAQLGCCRQGSDENTCCENRQSRPGGSSGKNGFQPEHKHLENSGNEA